MRAKTLSAVGAFAVLVISPVMHAQTFSVIHKFHLKDGQAPQGTLVRDSAGNLYGTTVSGGSTSDGRQNSGYGTIFKIDTQGHETVLHSFLDQSDGASPYAGLTIDGDSLVGAAYTGGDNADCPGGCGTVFKLARSGRKELLHAFTGAFNSPTDGAYPYASLLRDRSGNLFGTTSQGGISCFDTEGCGVVFEVNPSGSETVLYSFLAFNDSASDGGVPQSGLVEDAAGNLYGTTVFGGTLSCNSLHPATGCGTVFELSHNSSGQWTETVLYRFTGNADGGEPNSGLTIDSEGNLYGTTIAGGDLNCSPLGSSGCGTVFKLTHGSSGWTESVLYAFPGGVNGFEPESTLVRDSAGNLYGTTPNGGDLSCRWNSPNWGCGTVFILDASGKETILHSFSGDDGLFPVGGLLLDPSTHTLYGTTTYGGDIATCSLKDYYYGCGTVYKVGF
jgi:uncharacterized repeat protein (TIGR03803 family)